MAHVAAMRTLMFILKVVVDNKEAGHADHSPSATYMTVDL